MFLSFHKYYSKTSLKIAPKESQIYEESHNHKKSSFFVQTHTLPPFDFRNHEIKKRLHTVMSSYLNMRLQTEDGVTLNS